MSGIKRRNVSFVFAWKYNSLKFSPSGVNSSLLGHINMEIGYWGLYLWQKRLVIQWGELVN